MICSKASRIPKYIVCLNSGQISARAWFPQHHLSRLRVRMRMSTGVWSTSICIRRRISNFRVRYPPQTGSIHDAYAIGYSYYPPSNMTQQSSPNTPFFVAGDGNGRPIQKSADGAIPTMAYRVCVRSALLPRYVLIRTARIVFAGLYHVHCVKCK